MEFIQRFEHFWDFTDPFVNFWNSIFHLPDDMMRLAILLIASYVAAIIHRYYLPSTNARLYFSLFTGLFWTFFCFKWDALHYIGITLFTYLCCRLLPYKYAPRVVLFATFAHLSYGHYTRFTHLYLQYTVNWATPMMLMCIKLQSFAWSYYDGHSGEVIQGIPPKNKITREPSLIEFMSYIFFFAGFLTGPVGEFNDYIAFTDRTMFANEEGNKIPDSFIPALKKFALMFLGIVGFYSSRIINEHYCTTDAFDLEPFWYRALYAIVAVEIGFTKYYFAWFNGEAVTILIGFAYNGRDKAGNVLWTRVRMIELLPFKLANSRFDIATNWNICSGEWLKYYIYLRVPVSIRKVVSPVIITFGVSAFWHGFYPGYYLFFAFYAFYYFVEEAIDMNIKKVYVMKDRFTPKNVTYYRIYITVMTILTYVYINTITVAFRVLELQGSMRAWSSLYFYVHIIALLIYVYFKVFPYKPPVVARKVD